MAKKEKRKKLILNFSGLLVGTSANPLSTFMDDTDSIWWTLDRLVTEGAYYVKQVFFIPGNKILHIHRRPSEFIFLPKRNLFVSMISLLTIVMRADIIQINSENFASYFVGKLGRLFKCKIIHFVHNVRSIREMSPIVWITRLYFSFIPHVVVAVSGPQARMLTKEIYRLVEVFPYGVDTNMFIPDNESTVTSNGDIKLLFAGRVVPDKNIEDIILGIAGSRFNGRISLTIAGGIPLKATEYAERLRKMAKENRVNCIFIGFVAGNKMVPYYQEADVFVNLRKREALGKVFLEALACGVPVVGRIGSPGPEDIIDGKNGFLVSGSGGLSRLLDKLVSHPGVIRETKDYCRSCATRKYSYERAYEFLSDTYARLSG